MTRSFLRELALPLLAIVGFLALLFLVPLAHAQVVATPTEVAITSVDSAWDLVEQHGPIWGGMLLLFGIGTALVKRNDKAHWLAQGRVLAVVIGGLGVLGSVLEAGLNGGTWAGVIVTAFAALKLILSPTTGTSPPPTTGLAVSLLAVVAISAASCKPYLPPVTHPIVDCVNADQGRIKSLLDAFWPSGGTVPDWSSIEAQAIDAGITIGGCAIAAYVQRYLAPAPGTAAPARELGQQANGLLERARARAGGASFRFTDGDY